MISFPAPKERRAKMIRYISLRLLFAVPALWLIVTLVFLLAHIVPGDPVQQMLGEGARAEDLQQLRHALGLGRAHFHAIRALSGRRCSRRSWRIVPISAARHARRSRRIIRPRLNSRSWRCLSARPSEFLQACLLPPGAALQPTTPLASSRCSDSPCRILRWARC